MSVRILTGDVRDMLATLPDGSVHCVVTSPPYWGLRDYGVAGQIGMEPTMGEHIAVMVAVFREVRRVLRKDGTVWLNYGDCCAGGGNGGGGSFAKDGIRTALPGTDKNQALRTGTRGCDAILKPKDLCMIPNRLAIALQDDGWWVRSEIIWAKPNPMPESVTDRPATAHEKIWLLTKSARYFYDAEAVRRPIAPGSVDRYAQNIDGQEGSRRANGGAKTNGMMKAVGEPNGANLRNVWTIPTKGFNGWIVTFDLVPVPTSEVQELVASDSGCDDDMARTTSPDCPVHAGQSDQASKGFCDGLKEDQLNRIRGTLGRPAQDTADDSGSTRQTHDHSPIHPSTDDLPGLGDSLTAISRNKKTRKMGLDPGSSEHAIPCEEIAENIEHTGLQGQPLVSTRHDTAESKTEADNLASNCAPKIRNDNVHISESGNCSEPPDTSLCSCVYYRKVEKKQSHYATFPPDLIVPCIKAGTSEKGCCAECGAPWVRDVNRFRTLDGNRCDELGPMRNTDKSVPSSVQGVGHWRTGSLSQTTGWSPSCACAAATIPCTVLDPFIGSGTTAMVADRLGRDCIGIDLNPANVEMATDRITQDAGMFAEVGVE